MKPPEPLTVGESGARRPGWKSHTRVLEIHVTQQLRGKCPAQGCQRSCRVSPLISQRLRYIKHCARGLPGSRGCFAVLLRMAGKFIFSEDPLYKNNGYAHCESTSCVRTVLGIPPPSAPCINRVLVLARHW